MGKILIMIHGMGVHSPKWSDGIKNKFIDVASQYETFKKEPISDNDLLFSEITYDSIFKKYLDSWDKSSQALSKSFKDLNITPPFDITGWLKDASKEENNFFWSHMVDVLLYRLFPLVAAEVRTNVIDQLASILASSSSEGTPEVSILAHSLGTSVVHDSLAEISSKKNSELKTLGNFQFQNIMMVANVSKVLQTDFNPENPKISSVHPISANIPGLKNASCSRFYNFKHKFDLVPAVFPFKPSNWGADYYAYEDLEHLHEINGLDSAINVHDIEHYLDNPKAHIPMINAIFGDVISSDEENAAIKNYPQFTLGDPFKSKAEECLKTLNGLLQEMGSKKQNIETLITYGAKIYAEAKKFTDSL